MSDQKKEQVKIKFGRCDGVGHFGNDFSNSIVKKYVHKKIVKKIGAGEDEFVLEEKAVLIEEFDLYKRIQEEAKGADLKSLISLYLRTGDESVLQGGTSKAFGDFHQIPNDPIAARKIIDKANLKILDKLPGGLKGKSYEDLMKMSNKELLEGLGLVVKEKASVGKVKEPEPQPKVETPIEKGGAE